MKRQRGMVLIAVLVIASIAAMVAVTVMFRMRAETAAGTGTRRSEQARLAAISGIRQAMAVLTSRGQDPSTWQDDPDIFRDQQVVDNGSNRWYFTVYAPNPSDDTSLRYGPIDEGAKIDVNTADQATLLGLPGMTQSLVATLLDWRNADSNAQAEGAKQSYYTGLAEPYAMRNGPLATIEELLLIKGFTGEVVFGEDANRNGMLDPNEDDGSDTFPPDNGDGQLQPGLERYLTVWSSVNNVDSQGRRRVDLNGSLSALGNVGLSNRTLHFIEQYRDNGHTFSAPSALLGMSYQPTASGRQKGTNGSGQALDSGVGLGELPLVMDKLTTQGAQLVGRVNVNSAPKAVLAALPGMNAQLAGRIVAVRSGLDASTRQTVAWLYTQGVLTAPQFKTVAPYLSARSGMYRIRSVGFGVPCGQFDVLEAIVDVNQTPGRIIKLRDLTKLGLPMAIENGSQL